MSLPTKIEKLEELVRGRIVGEIVKHNVEPLVAPGENFGSIICKVNIQVKNGDEERTYQAVAKCTLPDKGNQGLFNMQVTMNTEMAWYTTLIPTIRNFQRQHGVEQVADFFQTFYGARINLDPNSDVVDLDAVILTENLIPLGYTIFDRHIGFDLKTSKAILRDLAIFHAVPMAIKLKDIELFEKNIKPYLPGLELKDNSSTTDQDVFAGLKNALKDIPEIRPYMERISINLKKNKSFMNQLTPKEPWGSVCHNDIWVNNIMIKKGDNIKTVFLDFQIAAYGSIAVDVVFFLILSVKLEVIEKHMDELINYYWNEFLKNLQQFSIDTSIFTFNEFLKEINIAASSGLFGRTLFDTHVVLQDKGFTYFDGYNENFNTDFKFNNRHLKKYRWLVSEFLKRNWI